MLRGRVLCLLSCLFSFAQNAFKQVSLLQISSILSQFLLVLSFLVLKNSQVSVFHLDGHFLGVSKLHHLQSSSGFCRRLSFVVAGLLSTNCVQENKEVFRSHNLPPLDSPPIIIIIHTVDSLKTVFIIGPRVGNQTWRWWSLYSSGGCCKPP